MCNFNFLSLQQGMRQLFIGTIGVLREALRPAVCLVQTYSALVQRNSTACSIPLSNLITFLVLFSLNATTFIVRMWLLTLTHASIQTRLRGGGYGVRIPCGTTDFSLLQIVRTVSWAHPNSYLKGTLLGGGGGAVKPPGRETDNSLHPICRLRMSGATLQLSLRAFMTWTRTMFCSFSTLILQLHRLLQNGSDSKVEFETVRKEGAVVFTETYRKSK
jgi:hypothetical protein